jgi:hypothetical protein
MSSIRRSSLSSITLGLLTVIRGYLSFASLGGAAGHNASDAHFSLAFDVGHGAGRSVLSLRWRLGPARFGSYDDATVQARCHAPASEAVTAVTGYSWRSPLFFGHPARPLHFLDGSECEGRVLINAQIAAGYALTLPLRRHWYLVLVLLVTVVQKTTIDGVALYNRCSWRLRRLPLEG